MKKRLMLVMGLAVAALGIGATAAVLGSTPAVFTRATGETRSIVLNAADFTAASGNFNKSGIVFHYEGISKNGNTVTMSNGQLYMTMDHYSGDSIEGGLRGNGFTALAIDGLKLSGAGYIIYGKTGTADNAAATYSVAANVDLTRNGEVLNAKRRRIHINSGTEGSISFTKITYTYECVAATPTVVISGDTSVNKGSTLNLTAETQDIANTATYTWTSSPASVATIVGDGKSATVTGVAGGDATITVQAVVNEAVVASDTFAITVIEEAATYYKVEVLASSNWVGAGLNYHINPSSVGKTSAQLGALTFSMELTSLTGNPLAFSMTGSHDYGNAQIVSDTDTNVYMTASRPPADNDRYSLRLEFRDAANNTIYYALAKFEGVAILPDVQITGGATSVDIDGDLALTAVINEDGFTPVSYVWSSSNDSIATVDGDDLTAIVTGKAVGTVDITLTVTDSAANALVGTFALTVTDPNHKVYMGWNKSNKDPNHGPIHFQGASFIISPDLESIHRDATWVNDSNNKKQMSFEFSKAGGSVVNWQTPPWAPFAGFYVEFGDAGFSSLTSITIRIPDNQGNPAVAEMTLSWSGSTYTVLTLNGQSFADYMAAA